VRIHIPVTLRWGDLDAYNHVNNVETLRVLEEARVRAFWAPDATVAQQLGEERLPTAVFDPSAGAMSLISGHRIEYVRPIDYQRAPLDVQLWFTRLSGARATIGYEVHSVIGLHARAASTMVFVDEREQRPRRMTPEELAAWEPYLGEPVAFSGRS
jgi:acyl-CoA thioester hydrolase